jgi:hypothetical protein
VANEWLVEGELQEREASYLLACGFPTHGGDLAASYDLSLPTFDSVRDIYRTLLVDESGEGHYAPGSATLSKTPPSLDAVLGAPVVVSGESVPLYQRRRRKPLADLIYTPDAKRVVKARLDVALASDCTLTPPVVWNSNAPGAGAADKWQQIPHGWQLLPDRIGIWINVQNPNAWHVGKGSVIPSGVIKLIDTLQGAAGNPALKFRLTCTIRGDVRCYGLATRQTGAVIRESVRRTIDAHDRYKTRTIVARSANNTTASDVVTRDDSALAEAEATATQLVTQAGNLVGRPIVIPRFTRFHRLGTRISQIQGRSVGFATNGSTTAAPTLPVVTRIRHEFTESSQRTTIEFSDADAARHSYMGRVGRRGGHHAPKR